MIIRTQHAGHDYVNGAHWIHLCEKCKRDAAIVAAKESDNGPNSYR